MLCLPIGNPSAHQPIIHTVLTRLSFHLCHGVADNLAQS